MGEEGEERQGKLCHGSAPMLIILPKCCVSLCFIECSRGEGDRVAIRATLGSTLAPLELSKKMEKETL